MSRMSNSGEQLFSLRHASLASNSVHPSPQGMLKGDDLSAKRSFSCRTLRSTSEKISSGIKGW